ncbi:signal transduction histidine kinase [Azospirillum lipoferum]|uniref:histidine kinase n=1 Tax=Azospirillum lipoferum TaxID=193 RepID=A0A5A9G7Z4_AZOLI|nr:MULTISPECIES: ATP-binding protein [Azospirillum]KAA0590477.1 PAS domain-containing protein [Azospirillum lipoferum]MCP1613368.1 signal transduction histidine kinase [Azospirillum lipoferum]MDW5533194.1 ATP-binding protein [Azospirillum sp. NL1]
MDLRHADLFEISPISILCEDWSGVKRAIDAVIAGGVEDFDRFLDDNPQFFFDVRRFHRILDANRSALDLLGFRDKETFLEESRLRLPANPASNAQVFKAMVRGDTVCQGERVLHTKDGRVVPILWRASLPAGPADPDAYSRLYFFAVDVSELKRVQDALMAAQANLSHAGRLSLVGELAASLTHEVSQPLVSIASHAAAATRWLSRQPPNLDEVATSLNRITVSTQHAVRIVGKMRSFARRGELVTEPMTPQDCIADAVTLVEHEAYRQKTRIAVDVPPHLPTIVGDRTQIQQVIVNIAYNAIQAMQAAKSPERRIAIDASADDGEAVTFTVADTGPGIPDELLARVFQPFFSTKEEGMGLGLSICKTIVEEHGGKLWAANGPQGAILSFSLPVASAQPATL